MRADVRFSTTHNKFFYNVAKCQNAIKAVLNKIYDICRRDRSGFTDKPYRKGSVFRNSNIRTKRMKLTFIYVIER